MAGVQAVRRQFLRHSGPGADGADQLGGLHRERFGESANGAEFGEVSVRTRSMGRKLDDAFEVHEQGFGVTRGIVYACTFTFANMDSMNL